MSVINARISYGVKWRSGKLRKVEGYHKPQNLKPGKGGLNKERKRFLEDQDFQS
jgi:hypothetical protein